MIWSIFQSTMINDKVYAASWSEMGRVNIWDLTLQLQTVENDILLSKYNKENKGNQVTPVYTFNGHQKEGFAMDWCSTMPGVSLKYNVKVKISLIKSKDD